MSLAEKSRINLLYLICSKEIINAGRFKKSVGVRHLINCDWLSKTNIIQPVLYNTEYQTNQGLIF